LINPQFLPLFLVWNYGRANEAAALKCVYLAVMSLDPTGQRRRRWTMRWKPALNAFEMTFEARLSAGRNSSQRVELHRFLDGPLPESCG